MSIELTNFLGSGGSRDGIPVGGYKAFFGEDKITTEEGEVWLKTGVLDNDIESYPDAYQTNSGFVGVPESALDSRFNMPLYVRIL